MKPSWLLLATMVACVFGAPIEGSAGDGPVAAKPLPDEGKAPSLGAASEWLNSAPLRLDDLRGKVVLINFWNFTCINWLRQLPYVRAWATKYRNQGLVVIGVHAPEFTFEKRVDEVRRAVEGMRVEYPIVIDSEHAIWRAFNNEYWPALYFVDARGHVRHRQFGEGDYEQSEAIIQQLLRETGAIDVGDEPAPVDARGVEAPADWGHLQSPETYLGSDRAENFSSPGGASWDQHSVYSLPATIKLNHWALAGDWTIEGESAISNATNGRIAYRFHARDLHLVLAPPPQGNPIRFRVRVDGHAPGANRGIDVDAEGWGSVLEPRLYQLVRQTGVIEDRTFEIEFLEGGVRAYAFTFG